MLPNQDAGSPIELPQYVANPPTICRFVELYASGQRISAPVASFVLARNPLPSTSLQSQRTACRHLLQKLLPAYSNVSSSAWRLKYSTSGVPRVYCNGKISSFQVSMAHSGVWLGVGLSFGDRIGIDVEKLRYRNDCLAIGKYLGWQNSVTDPHDFYARWTLWEASAKCARGSVLMRKNPGYDALCGVDLTARVGKSGNWCGMQDVFGDDVFFAIVVDTKQRMAIEYRELNSSLAMLCK